MGPRGSSPPWRARPGGPRAGASSAGAAPTRRAPVARASSAAHAPRARSSDAQHPFPALLAEHREPQDSLLAVLVRLERSRDLSVAPDDDPVAHGDNLRCLRGDGRTPSPAVNEPGCKT